LCHRRKELFFIKRVDGRKQGIDEHSIAKRGPHTDLFVQEIVEQASDEHECHIFHVRDEVWNECTLIEVMQRKIRCNNA